MRSSVLCALCFALFGIHDAADARAAEAQAERAVVQVGRGEVEASLDTLRALAKDSDANRVALVRGLIEAYRLGEAKAELAALLERLDGKPRGRDKLLAALGESDAGALIKAAAELDFRVGNGRAAVQRLEAYVGSHAFDHEARLLLGRALRSIGERERAHLVLDRMADFYMQGRLSGAADLTRLGYALQWTGHFKNANRVFSEAVKADPNAVEAELGWGWLFVDKYNYRDGDVSFRKVLAVAPHHPMAAVGMARIDVLSDNDTHQAEERLNAALARFPNHPVVLREQAFVAAYDERWDDALVWAQRAMDVNPADLESLSTLATVQFLRDDKSAFEETAAKALQIDPAFAAIFSDAAAAGERVHRYAEIVALYERALAIDPKLPAAHVGLGIGYSRLGRDEDARRHLDRAYELDPYHVRAVNLSNEFYDSVIRDFQWVEGEHLRFRFHRREAAVLEPLVVPYLTQAWDDLSKRYQHQLSHPVNIEIFPSAELFSVRTTGLPRMGAHGVCFGRVITSRSPSEGDFNWKQVLHHELAHAFHMELSHNRVPRWFTEGLAVHETRKLRTAWAQPRDAELYQKLLRGGLEPIASFNRAFTHAKDINDIVLAYYQASVLVQYIEETAGFDALRTMLVTWGEQKGTEAAVQAALGISSEELDRRFAGWLGRHLQRYDGNLSLDLAAYADTARFEKAAAAQPDSAQAQVEWALAQLAAGPMEGQAAGQALDRALALDPEHPLANLLAGRRAAERRDFEAAQRHLTKVVADGRKSLEARLVLGDIAVDEGDKDAIRRHFEAALAIEPAEEHALRALAALADSDGSRADALALFAKAADVNQSDAALARDVVARARQAKDSALAHRLADRPLEIAPFDAQSYLAPAQRHLDASDFGAAAALLERALELDPPKKSALRAWLAAAELGRGRTDVARTLAEQALADDPDDPTAKRVLEDID